MAFTWNLSLPAASPRQTLGLFLFCLPPGCTTMTTAEGGSHSAKRDQAGNGPLSQEWLGGSGKGLLIEQSSGLLTAPA